MRVLIQYRSGGETLERVGGRIGENIRQRREAGFWSKTDRGGALKGQQADRLSLPARGESGSLPKGPRCRAR